jgi:hypothetical protein
MINNSVIAQQGGLGAVAPTVINEAPQISSYIDWLTYGNVTADGGATVTDRGVVWSTSTSNPLIGSATQQFCGSGIGSFTPGWITVGANVTVYARAYAINSVATVYTSVLTFYTTGYTTPSVLLYPIASYTDTTATMPYYATNDGGQTITARGLCWNTTGSPTTANSKTNDGTGTAYVPAAVASGLSPSTTYYFRAYATNSVGTSYSDQQYSITTYGPPTLTTTAASAITYTTATSGGSISSSAASVTARGVCWNTSGSPTTANSSTSNGTGIGAFTSSLTSLTGGNTYYVRAYATSSYGTSYGNQISFATIAYTVGSVGAPTLLTVPNTSIAIQATGTSAGGYTTCYFGFVIATTTNPTVSSYWQIYTSALMYPGYYNTSFNGLVAGTIYYGRSFVTNPSGTAYGGQISWSF